MTSLWALCSRSSHNTATGQHLQNAVNGVEGQACKRRQRVLLVVLVVHVVQRPAAARSSQVDLTWGLGVKGWGFR